MKQEGIVRVFEYQLSHHIDHWYKDRGITPPDDKLLSDMGYMADERVAGWLYLTNSGIAMIENVIADPKSIPSLRRASLDKLIGFLIDTAVSLGYSHILGITKHPQIFKVGKKFGFQELADYKVIALSLGEE